ncbi:MAG TPA: hypothetical protein VKS20_13520 [Candidatus Acidoferrales bacterium]|nr:hypothetical protein [Candidatus Acidoferrales bacterium]
MSSTVDLSFRYLRSDYVRAVRANFGSRTRIWCDIIVIIIVAGLGVYLLKSQELRTGIVFIGLATVFVVVLIAGLTVIPTITFSHKPKFHDECSLAFSQEGIHFRTSQIDSQLKWSTYLRVLIDAHFVFAILRSAVLRDCSEAGFSRQRSAAGIRALACAKHSPNCQASGASIRKCRSG